MTDEVIAGSAAELATLYPVPTVATIAGRQVEIPAASIRHCTEVVQRGMALGAQIGDGADELIYVDEHPDEAAALLIFALPALDADWIRALDAFAKVDLGMAWLKVNGPFFVRRLLPARRNLREQALVLFGAGPTQSTGSNGADTLAPSTTLQPPAQHGSRSSTAPNGATPANA